MSDLYTSTLSASGYGIGDVTVTIERTSGNDCPVIAATYKNRSPFNPLGCTLFRLSDDPVVDHLYGFYPPCEFTLSPDRLNGLVSAIDFTTDNTIEQLSGETILDDIGVAWGTYSASNGKFGTGYRYSTNRVGTIPTFQGRSNLDAAPKPTTLCIWTSNLNGRDPASPLNAELVEFFFDAAGSGAGGSAYRLSVTSEAAFFASDSNNEIVNGDWPAGDWISMIITHDPDNTELKCYVNNVLTGTITDSEISTNLISWRLRGSITVAYAYDRILSAAERTSFQNLTGPIPIA